MKVVRARKTASHHMLTTCGWEDDALHTLLEYGAVGLEEKLFTLRSLAFRWHLGRCAHHNSPMPEGKYCWTGTTSVNNNMSQNMSSIGKPESKGARTGVDDNSAVSASCRSLPQNKSRSCFKYLVIIWKKKNTQACWLELNISSWVYAWARLWNILYIRSDSLLMDEACSARHPVYQAAQLNVFIRSLTDSFFLWGPFLFCFSFSNSWSGTLQRSRLGCGLETPKMPYKRTSSPRYVRGIQQCRTRRL